MAAALGAAVLFGLSTPAAKLLISVTDPVLLAGLLYLGSGLGLLAYRLAGRLAGRRPGESGIGRRDAGWLAAAIGVGGVVGPVLLMLGLAGTTGARASLLLNLEGVFTVLLARIVFREHVGGRVAAGMAAITAGAMVLSWSPAGGGLDVSSLLVIGACLAWALDNNLTRNVSASDPVQIVALKGLVAGAVNVAIARAGGAEWPPPGTVAAAAGVGVLGYGVSLVLFVLALRHLGAGRTAGYFSTAPFVGAAASVIALAEPVTAPLLAGGLLAGLGVWLHLSERHGHQHVHEAMEHDHLHWHDEHHQHAHAPGVAVDEPHAHPHTHTPLRHSHPHYPDLHHRHGH